MKTADFLPPKLFAAHMDRRRTPRRIALVTMFSLLCAGVTFAVGWETRQQEESAALASRPDAAAIEAQQALDALFTEMTEYALRLDPLAEHLRMPTAGPILAGLADKVGRASDVEKIVWKHELAQARRSSVLAASLVMEVTATVRGDRSLLELPGLLQEFTGYSKEEAKTVKTEVMPDRRDTMRIQVRLVGNLELPSHMLKSN